MASTVSNGNDRSEKWQRPFQMATTVYEREICVLVVVAVVLGNGVDVDVAVAVAVAVERCGSLERKWDFFPSDIHVLYITSNLVNKELLARTSKGREWFVKTIIIQLL